MTLRQITEWFKGKKLEFGNKIQIELLNEYNEIISNEEFINKVDFDLAFQESNCCPLCNSEW